MDFCGDGGCGAVACGWARPYLAVASAAGCCGVVRLIMVADKLDNISVLLFFIL